MTYYAALDVSLRSVAICIIDDRGEVYLERTVPSEVSAIVACLNGFGEPLEEVGFEAGTLSQYLAHGLQAAGFEVVCLETRQVHAALSAMRNKTDKTDARGIAQILRTGWYARVHVKSRASHCMRALLPVLDARLVLYRTYLELDRRVTRIACNDAVCRQLMSVPGVGPITALIFKAAVDDPRRFRRSRTVGAHFGLTPRRFQSGEQDNPGRISKAGDGDVRAALYGAAHSLMTRTNKWLSLKAWGLRLQRTKGRRRALVAVARKLAVIIHSMWMDGSRFQWSKEATAR